MVKIVVSGAEGRMGRRIIELASERPDFEVVAGVELVANPSLNIVKDLNEISEDYDCIIEFTTPAATLEHVRIAKEKKKAMVIGTTGLSEQEFDTIQKSAGTIPIVFSPNMSVCVNLFFNIIRKSAAVLGKDYKVNIREAHHIHKKDKPSGTARLMEKIVKEKIGNIEVPVESIREGKIVGDHDIIFESDVDTLKISHSAKTRDIFALGALKAAQFVMKKRKGLFSMSDVLGLKEL